MGAPGRLLLAAIALSSTAALAQPKDATPAPPTPELGAAHQIVLSGERLFGAGRFSATVPAPAGDQTTTANTFSALSGQWFTPSGGVDLVTFSFPRLALDYFATRRLSLGAAA